MNSDVLNLVEAVGTAEIYQNARNLRDFLRSKSDEIEDARSLPAAVVNALIEAGAFRMNMPKIWGGPEISSPEQVEIIEEISRGDASAGWCVMNGCDSGLYAGFIAEDRIARELYPTLDMVQAGWPYPVGQAHEIEAGYKVSGKWTFCSGSTYADMIAAGCVVYRDGEPVLNQHGRPEWRVMVAPASHWKLLDTWQTTGLRGTGSNDYTTHSNYLVVAHENSFSFFEPKRDGALWERPDALLRKMSGVPLGVARQAIEEVKDTLGDSIEWPSGRPYKELSRVKSAIGDAEMKLGAARSYVFKSLETQWQRLLKHEPFTDQERADVWLSRLNAFQSARDICQLLYDTIGENAVYTRRNRIDRALRDTATMCQHIVGQRKGLEDVGALFLGLDEQNMSWML